MPFLPLCFVRKPSCGLQSEVENGVLLFCSIFRPSQRKEKLFSHLEMVINKTVGQAICKKPEKLWYFNLFLKELPIQNLSWPSNVSCVKLQPARALESTSCFSYPKEQDTAYSELAIHRDLHAGASVSLSGSVCFSVPFTPLSYALCSEHLSSSRDRRFCF